MLTNYRSSELVSLDKLMSRASSHSTTSPILDESPQSGFKMAVNPLFPHSSMFPPVAPNFMHHNLAAFSSFFRNQAPFMGLNPAMIGIQNMLAAEKRVPFPFQLNGIFNLPKDFCNTQEKLILPDKLVCPICHETLTEETLSDHISEEHEKMSRLLENVVATSPAELLEPSETSSSSGRYDTFHKIRINRQNRLKRKIRHYSSFPSGHVDENPTPSPVLEKVPSLIGYQTPSLEQGNTPSERSEPSPDTTEVHNDSNDIHLN